MNRPKEIRAYRVIRSGCTWWKVTGCGMLFVSEKRALAFWD